MATAQLMTALTPENWTLTDPEKRANGSSSAWVNCADSGRPTFQTLRGDIAFEAGYGVKPEQMSADDVLDKMLKIEVNVRPENPDALEFSQMCARADQTLVKWGAQNSQRLFRQALDGGMVEKLLRPLVKHPQPAEGLVGGAQPKTYPPRFRIKIAKEFVTDKEGRQVPNPRKTQIFVVTGETTYKRGTVEDLRRGCDVICIVEIPSTWVSGMFFGYNVIAVKILVYPTSNASNSGLTFNLPTPMVMDSSPAEDAGMDM
jgi:hypothetical protein